MGSEKSGNKDDVCRENVGTSCFAGNLPLIDLLLDGKAVMYSAYEFLLYFLVGLFKLKCLIS